MIDARTLDPSTPLTCDICIVGTGPAGTTLATQLIASGLDVILLEAGDFENDQLELGAPATGFKFGADTNVINTHRYGGNANAWSIHMPGSYTGVRFAKLQPGDLSARAPLRTEHWPFTLDTLEPYAARAALLWGVRPDGFNPDAFVDDDAPLLKTGDNLVTSMFQFAQASTPLKTFRESITTAANIRLFYNAPVARVRPAKEAGHKNEVDVTQSPGHTVTIRADKVILACGCMNATRILFNSTDQNGDSPGNTHDQLGRYFMDHLMLNGGHFYPTDKSLIERMALYDLRMRNGVPVMAHLHFSDAALDRLQLPALAMMMYPRDQSSANRSASNSRQKRAHNAALAVRHRLLGRRLPHIKDILIVLTGLDEVIARMWRKRFAPESNVGSGGWSLRPRQSKKYNHLEVIQIVEQRPHSDNRLILSDETDKLGHRRVTIDWRLHPEDSDLLQQAQEEMARALKAAGLGEYKISKVDGGLDIRSHSCCHYLGGTRMGDDAKHSVVDRNCKVHDTSSLYVLTGGVFPTGGFANPTFTIVTLAIRMADHLKSQFGS